MVTRGKCVIYRLWQACIVSILVSTLMLWGKLSEKVHCQLTENESCSSNNYSGTITYNIHSWMSHPQIHYLAWLISNVWTAHLQKSLECSQYVFYTVEQTLTDFSCIFKCTCILTFINYICNCRVTQRHSGTLH